VDNEWQYVLDLHNISIDDLLDVVVSLHLIKVLVAGSYQSPSVSAYPLVLGYVLAVELGRGYIVALKIVLSLMHKLA
jgi:hypothetical protein